MRQNLSSSAFEWLEGGYYVELESFSPKVLLKVVKQKINETIKTQLNQDKPSEIWLKYGIDFSTENTIIYSADSFS